MYTMMHNDEREKSAYPYWKEKFCRFAFRAANTFRVFTPKVVNVSENAKSGLPFYGLSLRKIGANK